jgi:preprotein translocase subunit YajC
MHWNTILAQVPAAAPQAATTTATTGTQTATTGTTQSAPPNWLGFAPMILVVVAFYFILIRPQSQQRKKQAALLSTLKSGDKVITASGIIGVVITVKDTTVSIRSADAKMEVTKASVVQILDASTATES